METMSSSVSSVVGPQSVPSQILVVLVEETEVQGAKHLASIPVDETVRLLAGVACPAGVTVGEDCMVMSGAVGMLSPSDSDGTVGHVGTLSLSDSNTVGSDGALSSSNLAGILFPAVPAGIPFPVGHVGPVGMLSPSDSVGPVGPDGTLSSSDLAGILFPAVPAGIPFPVGPVGPVGTLSPSDFEPVSPVGPVWTLSPSDFESACHVGPVGTLSPFDHVEGLSPIVPVGVLSSVDPARGPPGGLVPVVWTEFPDRRDPVITQLPAEVPVGDNRDVMDMDVTVDICPVVPDVINSRAVVAMVGLDMVWMGEETPMDCDGECAERDIRNEFETVDGMPVYYGGDLYDSDDSHWEDHRDLAYAEYVDLYNFDAPEGMELKFFERLRVVDEPVMMVGEVTGPGLVRQNLLSGSLSEADIVCTEPVADILTVGHEAGAVVQR